MPHEPLTADKSKRRKTLKEKAALYLQQTARGVGLNGHDFTSRYMSPTAMQMSKGRSGISSSAGSDELVNAFGRMWQNLFT